LLLVLFQRTREPRPGDSVSEPFQRAKTDRDNAMHGVFKNTLAGKVALVTGAGSGIGKATARLFAQAGARVAALTRSREEAEATAAEIRGAGGEAIALVADISKSDQLAQGVQQIAETWERLDLVVANAGINGLWAPVDEIGEADWDEVVDINLKGTFLTVKFCVPHLKKNGGAIVLVSSVNGTRIFSNGGASVYASTKAAQLAFGRMMALELARHRIRVNTVCPGSIETNIDQNTRHQHLDQAREPVIFPEGYIPLTNGRPGTADQVAELIWFLSSGLASHITGAEVFIDGGESLLQG
jgi:NAD(P)-dependent dehydrogenase (short-subunit alcohol dehydrogenase family)